MSRSLLSVLIFGFALVSCVDQPAAQQQTNPDNTWNVSSVPNGGTGDTATGGSTNANGTSGNTGFVYAPGGGQTAVAGATDARPQMTIYPSDVAGFAPLTASLDIQVSGGDVPPLRWDFGDNSEAFGTAVDHTYAEPGLYDVTVWRADIESTAPLASAQVLALPSITIDSTAVTPDGELPATIDFGAHEHAVLPDANWTYTWDFGDGAQDEGPAVSHAYQQPGTYMVSLTLVFGSVSFGCAQKTVVVTERAQGDAAGTLHVSTADDLTITRGPLGELPRTSWTFTLEDVDQAPLHWSARRSVDWVSLSNAGGDLNGGASTTVEVSLNAAVIAGFPPGQYVAKIFFDNESNGAGSVSFDVVLNALPPATLSVTPAEGFSSGGPAGGPFVPHSTTYLVKNLGASPLTWGATPSESWIDAAPASGTLQPGAEAQVEVSITSDADALTPSIYSGAVNFTNTLDGSSNTVRMVSLAVNAPAGALTVSPAGGLNSAGLVGGPFTPSSQAYTITNTGGTAIAWTADATQNWVTLSSTGGTLDAGASATLTASINASAGSLAAGSYSDTITITNATNGAGNTTRAVSLNVIAPGGLVVTPGSSLSSSGVVGGPFTPGSQVYTLTNSGGAAINWTAAKTQNWVSLSASSGTLSAGGTTTVTVLINSNANSLTAGSYNDTISFANTTNGGGNTTRGVALTVIAPGALTVSPTSALSSSGLVGGPFSPGSKIYTLSNNGGAAINWTAAKTQNWVSLSATSGTLNAGGTTTVTVSINSSANSLAAGSYNDTVSFSNTTNGGGNTTRGVALTVIAPGALSVTPTGGLVSSGPQGGPFSPASQVYTLTNSGGASINWTAAKTQNWLTLSSASGTLAAGGTTTVTVSYNSNANTLTPGSYSDIVTFTNSTNGTGNTTRPVSLTVNAPPGVLSITPSGNLVSSGPAGGPFSPSSIVYTLQNTGGQAINWTAAKTQTWVTLSATSGALNAGASTTVTVSLNSGANALVPGSYADTVTFTNTTNGTGNGTRAVQLTVNATAGSLAITPAGNLTSSGPVGGPFSPASIDYTLNNPGGQAITWSASATQNWITLSSSGGTLTSGASTTVTVSIDADANALAEGSYSATINFTNVTNGSGNASRSVALTVSNGPQMASSVTQYGITWTFDQPHQVGQFVTGDWWVLGPATVVSVSPAPTGSGALYRNGSQLNPVGEPHQGYDARAAYYDATRSVSFPLAMVPEQSLVSTQSRPENDPDRPNITGSNVALSRVTLWRTAVLTCVSSPPSASSFRPPYAGTEKPIFDSTNLRRDRLLSLPAATGNFYLDISNPLQPGQSRCQQFARYFQRPWLLHVNGSSGEAITALENGIGYYSGSFMIESEAALLLCCNVPNKDDLLIAFVQYGIDMYYCAKSYSPNDTIRNDRRSSKWPMLFAGIMLDSAAMQSPPSYTVFKTDAYTYYGVGWNGATALWCFNDSPTMDPNNQYEHLSPFDDGTPCMPWCHSYTSYGECGTDTPFWKAESYRRMTHSWNWVGSALAARLMGAKSLWNHAAFFDYVDRWMNEDESSYWSALRARGAAGPCGDGANYDPMYPEGFIPISTFTTNMWHMYR